MINCGFSFEYNNKKYFSDKSIELGNGVKVELEKKQYDGACEWMLYFVNDGKENSGIFENIFDCDSVQKLEKTPQVPVCYKPEKCDCTLTYMVGMTDFQDYMHDDELSATEYLHRHVFVNIGEHRSFFNNGGRSSDVMTPFFRFEAMGKGYVVAVGWTGDWQADFSREDVGMRVRTGLKNARFYLLPGEKIRTTSVLIMEYEGEYTNSFRRIIKERYALHAGADRRTSILAYELWGGLPAETMIERITERHKHNMPFKDCWIDAGWYGDCTKCDESFTGDWSQHTGDWHVNKRVHPNEFEDVRDVLKKIGMNIMLWFETERATLITPIEKEHPDWLMHVKDNDSAILDLGNENAWQYAFELLSGYIKKLDMKCYRQDFNVELTEFFASQDKKDRRGITEIGHITGLYRLWDALLETFPELIIDNCSSGGRRVDIETLKRAIPFFRSDYMCVVNANPEVLQLHNTNISAYLPYTGCTNKSVGDVYTVRSTYSSSFGRADYGTVAQKLTESELEWDSKYVNEYVSLQHYFDKDFYNHASCVWDPSAWTVWQYHDPDTDSGIVMAFRRSGSPFERMNITLRGVDGSGRYSCRDLDTGEEREIHDTFEIYLKEKRSSVIFEYKKI